MSKQHEQNSRPRRTGRFRKILGYGALGIVALSGILGAYHGNKPLPSGLSMAFPLRAAPSLQFWADYTYWGPDQQRHFEQEIFDEVLRLISQARRVIVMDMFLFNDFQGAKAERHRALSSELSAALIAQKQQYPDLKILVISDPFNTLYGGVELESFKQLRAADIQLVLTDLNALRDSNPSWSGFWRLAFAWMGNSTQGGWLPSPISSGQVSLRSYLKLLNFKANHRKTLVVDEGTTLRGLVTSANPHDGSSAHGNVALSFSGKAAGDLLVSELAVARFSGAQSAKIEELEAALSGLDGVSFLTQDIPQLQSLEIGTLNGQEGERDKSVQILTEGEILKALLRRIDRSQAGEKLDISVFYFSHRQLVKALLAAHARRVQIRVLLDPNKDAFGRKKNGIPNRQVALELHEAGIPVRWCDTHGEQCHSKFFLARDLKGRGQLILGSANYTRRNLDDLNLETSVRAVLPAEHAVLREALAFFERRWSNPPGQAFSLPYAAYADDSALKHGQYRLMEATGWSTF